MKRPHYVATIEHGAITDLQVVDTPERLQTVFVETIENYGVSPAIEDGQSAIADPYHLEGGVTIQTSDSFMILNNY
jgi:hypothetical protein